MKTKLLYLSMVVAVILSACKGEKGEIGPQGAQGSQGSQGQQGNANVSTITATANSWVYNGNGEYYASFSVPPITQSIVDYGAVISYWDIGVGEWVALPTTEYPSSTYSATMTVVHSLGTITFWFSWSDQQPGNPGTQVFKVVILAGSLARDNPDVDYNNYREVKATFNLQD